MSTSDDTELTELLEAFLTRLIHSQTKSDLHAMVDVDLPVSQFRCLVALADLDGPVSIHVLADRLQMSLATAGRNIDRLVAQDLVLRREDEHDRRVRLVSLSEAGACVVSGMDNARRRTLLSFTRSLPEQDRDRLRSALRPIVPVAADLTTSTDSATSHPGEHNE